MAKECVPSALPSSRVRGRRRRWWPGGRHERTVEVVTGFAGGHQAELTVVVQRPDTYARRLIQSSMSTGGRDARLVSVHIRVDQGSVLGQGRAAAAMRFLCGSTRAAWGSLHGSLAASLHSSQSYFNNRTLRTLCIPERAAATYAAAIRSSVPGSHRQGRIDRASASCPVSGRLPLAPPAAFLTRFEPGDVIRGDADLPRAQHGQQFGRCLRVPRR